MTGKWITDKQKRIYMEKRKQGDTQELAAAKSGISTRSGKRVESKNHQKKEKHNTAKKNSRDPFKDVWESDLVPLLEKNPKLQSITLLQHLQEYYEGKYPDSLIRTLQRRVQKWKAIYGPEKEVIFRQNNPPGWQGLSDFTNCNELNITINGQAFPHLLYHFRLAFSGWEYAFVITGGESYPALSEGFQGALWALGGVPQTHRTDSLSAAYRNHSKLMQEDFTKAYEELCEHYSIEGTRNNKGISHENGTIEVSHRHLKSRLNQALIIRDSRDFNTLSEYRDFVEELVIKCNNRINHLLKEEREFLKPLPKFKTRDFDIESVRVPTTSIITIRQVRYSVPSKFIGARLKAHIFDDHIECFLGSTKVISLERLRWKSGARPTSINYQHLVWGLSRKPQAFRNYRFRDSLFPTFAFKVAWELLDAELDDRSACKEYVTILKLAVENEESLISQHLEKLIASKTLPKAYKIEELLLIKKPSSNVKVAIEQRDLDSYNQLLKLNSGEN